MTKKCLFNLTLAFFTLFIVSTAGAAEEISSFSILQAEEKGMFNIGPAIGDAVSEKEPDTGKHVLKFDYTIFPGAIAGVWTKGFPDRFSQDAVDAVRFAVKARGQDELNQVSVKLEIKGDRNMQTVPVDLKLGWSYSREAVDWARIGNLKEVVFVISPLDANKRLEGILYFDLDFYKLTSFEKYFTFLKFGLVFALGLIMALAVFILGRIFGRGRPAEDRAPVLSGKGHGIKQDFLYGIITALIIAVSVGIYAMGKASPLDSGFSLNFIAAGLAGALIAQLLKSGITGRHLDPSEVFQNIIIAGCLAASSGRQGILQAPSSWVQLFTFSKLVSTIIFIVYQIFNVRSFASSGRQLRTIATALIVGTPYLFNWLLLLESPGLLTVLAKIAVFNLPIVNSAVLETTGRAIVVFIFNELVVNGFGVLIKGRPLKTFKAHVSIFMVSLGVVIAPLIADLGSTSAVASLPVALRALAAMLATMLSFGGLWGEVYLITGVLLDGGHRLAPTCVSITKHVTIGTKKGMAYSGILVAMLYLIYMALNAPLLQKIAAAMPIFIGILSGALVFPVINTTVETFDGSIPFFQRIRYNYRNWTLYLRGAIIGFGFIYMVTNDLFKIAMSRRILFGLVIGILASGGISMLRDLIYQLNGKGKVQSWRMYFVDSLLGGFVGSAAAFYLDSLQVPVIVEKFKVYTSSGFSAISYITYPFVNKWGRIDLGTYSGGAKLLFIESLAGVINWSIAAWLFAINKVFMQAYFEKDKAPIKFFFSKAGFAQLMEHMIYVLRWGLWMSPIIFTGLRMMPDPTWYNQDGAIRTIFAAYHNLTLSPDAFRAWSMQVFIYIMAFDIFRILIWMDHMGLRVATLVNLSFLGLDRLDEKIARFIGPATAQRYIPDGVKRFATWAPLLIPFYLPRGSEWDRVWNTSLAMQNAAAAKGGALSHLESLGMPNMIILISAVVLGFTAASFIIRSMRRKSRERVIKTHELSNRDYKVVVKENAESYSEVFHKECDISRRSYDMMDPCGRILYLVDTSKGTQERGRFWPVVGNFPKELFDPSRVEKLDDSIKIVNGSNGIRTTVRISLPDGDSAIEVWEVRLENLTDKARKLKAVPYLEWVLNGGIHDRFHTQYARLFPEMEYTLGANAILAWHKGTKSIGILASDAAPEGFLSARVDFIGRARSIWSPRVLETLDFTPPKDSAPYPTFDPIGSIVLNAEIPANSSKTINLMIGYAKNKITALDLINKNLRIKAPGAASSFKEKKKAYMIGHGEIPPGTPEPYSEFTDNGKKILVHTPFTPRPYDHAMSNEVHSVMVTNRGLHTSCNGNSQQNRLTPDWPDTVTKEVPTEAIYLYDIESDEWYSPTHHPLNDSAAKNKAEFGVDGTALFRMTRGAISTELTVFVPPDDPLGVYMLKIKNDGEDARRIRVAPYFSMVLAFQPERSGVLKVRHDKALNALFFRNPRNEFRQGPAFVSMTIPAEAVETKRGRFFGAGRWVKHPFMVEKGRPDTTELTDTRQIASFLGTIDIPANGESTVAFILGQTDTCPEAVRIVKKYRDIETVRKSLEDTRKWWLALMGTAVVETNNPEFDYLQDWLKYQALAERIWARRGFYQTSGAFGFRDQLQDTVNMIWVDPSLARKQIILHAKHQLLEGDVYHWFFTRTDGRTAFACRSHASDNPVWLVWGVVEYIRTTGDYTILDEMASYAVAQFPFAPLPKNKQGWGHLYHRSTCSDSIYRHCLKSIDLVLEKRMGKNGLPLIGTGDWNDGLDEIGSEGRGESVWLGFFLYYILKDMLDIIDRKEGRARKEHYSRKLEAIGSAIEKTWRGDRYLRAIHDDGTEIGVKGSGVWEIDALTASWAVICGINPERGEIIFNTALNILEKENAILLGWPALREDTKPYLGRSSKYPEGVRENGMYCHGVQWLVRAARIIAERLEKEGDHAKADEYRRSSYRLWLKISPIAHVKGQEIEIYGGQPNKQSADILTNFDQGRMIWHGYTGAAGWMLRQALEGVVGASLANNELILPDDLDKPRGELKVNRIERDVKKSPIRAMRPD